MNTSPALVWFRHDLRTSDNPALDTALKRRGPIVPVFVWAPEEEGEWRLGAASCWWLHQSLKSLEADLQQLGSRLILRRNESFAALEQLIQETGAEAIYWNRRYDPAGVERDRNIKAILKERGLNAQSFNGSLLYEPWSIKTKQGRPYQVFTPFWKACAVCDDPPQPTAAPSQLPAPKEWPDSAPLDTLTLEPSINWTEGMQDAWQPGAAGAAKLLQRFLRDAAGQYKKHRDVPGETGTSRLSPHLRFGEISPRQVWHAVRHPPDRADGSVFAPGVEAFSNELGWREFAYHVLYHFPETTRHPLKSKFDDFPWHEDDRALKAWQQGQTGFPIIDAGMRELWETGWMHNRVRMLVGSFLTKDLLISWREGARWFWDTLVDADLANNTFGWQWISGCGADAAPYFRVFNPVSQAEKFDPAGEYVRRWVPELKNLPDRWVQQPGNAPDDILRTAGVEIGTTYPRPIVDHSEARLAALDAFASIKNR